MSVEGASGSNTNDKRLFDSLQKIKSVSERADALLSRIRGETPPPKKKEEVESIKGATPSLSTLLRIAPDDLEDETAKLFDILFAIESELF